MDFILHSIQYYKLQYSLLSEPLDATDSWPSTIGLHGIDEQIDSYASLNEFLADIDRLVHTYSIKYSGKPNYSLSFLIWSH